MLPVLQLLVLVLLLALALALVLVLLPAVLGISLGKAASVYVINNATYDFICPI